MSDGLFWPIFIIVAIFSVGKLIIKISGSERGGGFVDDNMVSRPSEDGWTKQNSLMHQANQDHQRMMEQEMNDQFMRDTQDASDFSVQSLNDFMDFTNNNHDNM